MPFLNTPDNCRLYFETFGQGERQPALVFLNGTAQDTLYWRSRALARRRHLRVLTYDARGQGQSGLGALPLSLHQHVEDLTALLAGLEIDCAHLVGLSHGAYVALALAAEAPQHVGRLVLCSAGTGHTRRSQLIVRSWLEILKCAGLEAMAWASLPMVLGEQFLPVRPAAMRGMAAAIVQRNQTASLVAHLEAMLQYPPLESFVSKVTSPSLVIAGDDDPLVAPAAARRLAKLVRGRLELVEGAGHSLPAEVPRIFDELMDHFLGDPFV